MITEEGLVGHVDAFASLLLRHLVEDRVVETARRLLLIAQLSLECHHRDFHVLVPLLHLHQIVVKLVAASEGFIQFSFGPRHFALLLENLVVQLVYLEREVLVLLK
jgi:hypothetical protein